MTTTTTDTTPHTHTFQAEVSRLLHLMVHSVYSDRDIFLRELISNAADACEKLRFLAASNPALAGDTPLKVTIKADPAAHRLVVADNGIGMSADDLVSHLGTIARSGTKAFLDQLGDKPEGSRLIGQFGVGFYSAFMVAGSVRVTSRKAGTDEAHAWISDGLGTFSVEPVALADAPEHGTRVELSLNDDSVDYAETATIERIVRAWSAHVPVPIELVTEGAEPRELTDGTALWTKPKSEITPKDYAEFYGNVSGQWDEPALTVHMRAEGRHEYSALLFVPSEKPFDMFDPERKGKVKLYVRRVFITDEAPLLPAWARFVRGLVDSEDLPLNLSREMLQSNPVLDAIRKALTSRLLSELSKLAENDAEKYAKVWSAFGPVLKEGIYEDHERRDDLLKLARFRTSTSGEVTRSLADYVAAMKPEQKSIFYVTAEGIERAASSPHLEGFRARGIEVLLLTDPVDAFWVQANVAFEGKALQSITQGTADLEAIPLTTPEPAEAETPAGETDTLIAAMKLALGDRVSDVRISKRLAESPVCLVAPDFGMDRQFERLMSRHQGSALTRPVLEINPRHGLIRAISSQCGDSDVVKDATEILFGQARILDGEQPDDPADFARRLDRVLAKALGV